MNWHRPLTDLLPPAGTATARLLAGAHVLVVAAATFLLWWPVIHGELGLGGMCILFAWLGLVTLHVESAFHSAPGRCAGGAATLTTSLAVGCAVGWVGLPALVAILVGSSVAIGLGLGWRRSAYPPAIGAGLAALVAVVQVMSEPTAAAVALVVGMAAFIVIRRNQHVARRGGLRSLLLIPLGATMTVLATGVVTMVVASNALTDADVDVDVAGLVTHSFTDPDTIEAVSLFRSQFGHTFADSTRSTSSMKHYLHPVGEESSMPSFAPFDGEVVHLTGSGGGGHDLWVRPTSTPNVRVRFFHVDPTPEILSHFSTRGDSWNAADNVRSMLGLPVGGEPLPVSAGDLLGTGAGDISMEVTDWSDGLPFFCSEPVAWSPPAGWFSPMCTRTTRLVSIFGAMTPAVSDEWAHWGLTIDDIVVSQQEREAHSTFDAGFNPYFQARNESAQIEILGSLGLPVIEVAADGTDVEFPVGGVLLSYAADGVRATTSDGREVGGTFGGVDGVLSPLYPKPGGEATGSTFSFRLTGAGPAWAVAVPPELVDGVVRPLASLLNRDGEYFVRTSGG